MVEAGKIRRFVTSNDRLTHNFPYPVCLDSLPLGPNIRSRGGTLVKSTSSAAVYIVEHGGGASYAKRHIISPDALTFYGFNVDPITSWPSAEVSAYNTGFHVHPVKSLVSDSWYKSLVTNDLTFHRAYDPSVQPGVQDSQINAAINAWNGDPSIVVDFVELPIGANDVRIEVNDYAFTHAAEMAYVTNGAGTILYTIVRLNVPPGASDYAVTHELGHVLGMTHDGNVGTPPNEAGDAQCGAVPVPPPMRVAASIMDADCPLPIRNWDNCGVNHKHYSSAVGWAGC